MKNNKSKFILILILTIHTSITLNAQNLLNDPRWDNFNQGKDTKCNNLFDSLLTRSVYSKPSAYYTYDYYAIGYLKNIDYYYVSYRVSDSHTVDFISELFRIDSTTDISSFDYTKNETMLDDPNENHCVFWEMGQIDSFDDYLVFYDKRHVAIYKKSDKTKEYIEISNIGNIVRYVGEELIYDRINKQIKKKIYNSKSNKIESSETYKIVNGEIIKLE